MAFFRVPNFIFFLGRFHYILDSDEYCLFSQEDVAWYGDTFNPIDDGLPDVIFDIIAAGTLYLTNKQVILYDPGFSNIWTKLSVSGDFPEQVKTIDLRNIREVWGDTHMIRD